MRAKLLWPAAAVAIVLLAWMCGVSLHPPASWSGAADQVLPDPVKPRPAPNLPPVTTAPLVLAEGQTVVTLTFDDGRESNALAARILHDHGLSGTFFLNSGNIGKPEFLTLPQVDAMAKNGHEIAGHTVTHPHFDTLSNSEVIRQVCGDRDNWLAWGFPVRNFAYPFGYTTAEIAQVIRACGYNSARTLADVSLDDPPSIPCQMCDLVETVPPANPMDTRAPTQVRDNWNLGELQTQVDVVTASGGGWLQLTFHGICSDSIALSCSDITTPEYEFESFVAWLAEQQLQDKFIVRTVGDVIGGAVHPAVLPPAATQALVNGDLKDNKDGQFSCWQRLSYGNNQPEFSLAPGRNDGVAERILVHDYHDGEAGLLSAQDLGTCAVPVTPGATPTMTAWYRSTVPTQFVVHYRTSRGNWSYFISGPVLPAALYDWTLATWKVPPVPKGATAISFGLAITSNGELTTGDYGLQR